MDDHDGAAAKRKSPSALDGGWALRPPGTPGDVFIVTVGLDQGGNVMAEEAAVDQQDLRAGRRRLWMVGSLVALLALAATFIQAAPADAASPVGIGEPRIISTTASLSGSSATLRVRVRSAKNVKQVRIYLFSTDPLKEKRRVVGHLSSGTNNDGSWTGTANFSGQELRGWRIGKVRVLGSHDQLLRSKAIAKNTAAVLILSKSALAVVAANARTQGPESARTTKFALTVLGPNGDDRYQNVPVRVSPQFRRPSGTDFVRSIETRTNEHGKIVVTFGPYHMARVRGLALDLPDPTGGTFSIFFDLR